MARRSARIPLNVFLNGKLVGRLQREPSGAIEFQYDRSWLEWESAITVSLSLPLREDRYIGAPVFAVFDNLLPDNEGMRRRVAETAGAQGPDAFSLLAAIGRDCVGALQFLPAGVDPGKAGDVSGRRVNDSVVASIIANLDRNPLGIGDDAEFRIALAGAQEKTALLSLKKKWLVPHGSTATTHILKPEIGKLENGIDMSLSVENELLCMELVRALGLPAAPTKMVDFAGRRVLVVERFDRVWAKDGRLLRVPQEDFCQALSVPPNRKYQADGGPSIVDISNLLLGSDQPAVDRRTFFKSQVVFWLLAAVDGHAKNFSVQLSSGCRFKMTPLYDVMSVQPAIKAKQISHNKTKLAMSLGKSRHYVIDKISPRHFEETADECGLPSGTAREVFRELVDTTPKAIQGTLGKLPKGFPAKLGDQIAEGALARLKQLERALTSKAG
ncbi:MAG: type II toxin-antitoxin system HipA family toxin [Hyphomicrobium sp.]|jgi:serine/threonine-protein kinase HipA